MKNKEKKGVEISYVSLLAGFVVGVTIPLYLIAKEFTFKAEPNRIEEIMVIKSISLDKNVLGLIEQAESDGVISNREWSEIKKVYIEDKVNPKKNKSQNTEGQ